MVSREVKSNSHVPLSPCDVMPPLSIYDRAAVPTRVPLTRSVTWLQTEKSKALRDTVLEDGWEADKLPLSFFALTGLNLM